MLTISELINRSMYSEILICIHTYIIIMHHWKFRTLDSSFVFFSFKVTILSLDVLIGSKRCGVQDYKIVLNASNRLAKEV